MVSNKASFKASHASGSIPSFLPPFLALENSPFYLMELNTKSTQQQQQQQKQFAFAKKFCDFFRIGIKAAKLANDNDDTEGTILCN